jgi:hypothetical protein
MSEQEQLLQSIFKERDTPEVDDALAILAGRANLRRAGAMADGDGGRSTRLRRWQSGTSRGGGSDERRARRAHRGPPAPQG